MQQSIALIVAHEGRASKRAARAFVQTMAALFGPREPNEQRWPFPGESFFRRLSDWSRSEILIRLPVPHAEPAPTNVLLVTHDLSLSGAPRIVLEIADILRSAGHGVVVISPTVGPLEADLLAIGVTLIIDPRAFDAGARTLRSLADAAEAVVCNTIVAHDAVRIAYGRAPVLWYLHEVSLIEDLLKKIPSLPAELAMATELWCGSELSAALVRCSRPDTAIVPYGVTPFEQTPHDEETCLRDARLRICVFGSVERRKGQDLAAAALSHLSQGERDQVELVFHGRIIDASMLADIESLSSRLPLRYGGELDTDGYRQAMLACDVVLVSSRDDTLPLVSLDALGAGRLLACTPTTGTAAYLRDGIDGFVAKATNGVEIAAMLSRVLARREAWPSIRENGRQVFTASFSKEMFAGKVLAFVDRALVAQPTA